MFISYITAEKKTCEFLCWALTQSALWWPQSISPSVKSGEASVKRLLLLPSSQCTSSASHTEAAWISKCTSTVLSSRSAKVQLIKPSPRGGCSSLIKNKNPPLSGAAHVVEIIKNTKERRGGQYAPRLAHTSQESTCYNPDNIITHATHLCTVCTI